MSVARKILWNTGVQILGKALVSALGVVVLKLITNYLGKSGYGNYTAAFEFLAFFSIVADLGLYTVGVREMAKKSDKVPMIIGNILTIRTIVAALIISCAIVSAYFIPLPGHKNSFVVLWSAASVFNLLTSTISTVLQVYLKMDTAHLLWWLERSLMSVISL